MAGAALSVVKKQDQLSRHTRHLRIQYAKQLPMKAGEIAEAWRTMQRAGLIGEGCLRDLADRLHSLAGSAGVFGYTAVSEAAQRFEMFLRGVDDHESRPVSAWLTEQMESFLAWLDMAQRLNDEAHLPPVNAADEGWLNLPLTEDMAYRRSRASVYLLEDDLDYAKEFCLDLETRGYSPRHFVDLAAFAAALEQQSPDVAILDMALDDSLDGGAEALAVLRRSGKLTCPIVFLTGRGDFQARLSAVRAGASHYFVKPVDVGQLSHALDGLVSGFNDVPYRVALLQSDSAAANIYRRWMEEAGMRVVVAANADAVLELLDAQRPELLLIDLHMADCSGPEVAAVARQLPGYAEMPIVFISGDSAEEKHLAAMYQGGDTFLVKPVPRARLIESVKMRMRRYRNLQWSSRQAQLAVHELQEFKEALDQHAIVSITDRAGVIIYANSKFCEVSGYGHEELIGQNHRIVKGDMDPAIYEDFWRTIASGRVWRGELRNKRKNGSYYWVECSIVPLSLDENGVPERYIGIRTEVTALKEVQEALAESEERFKRSQYYANVGTWDWDMATGEVFCSERVGALFGSTEVIASLSSEKFLGAVYANDRDRVAAAIADCVDAGVALDVEHRVLWPDDDIHWLHHRGGVVRAADGQPPHLLGVVTEVTRRKQAEEALLQQKDLLEVLRQAVLRYIGDDEAQDIAAYLLQAMLDLTDSEYGFLGEVRFDDQGDPYLYTHAVRGNAWDEVGCALYDENQGYGLEFRDPDSLASVVLTSGKPVISNDVANDPRRSKLPPGHRAMNAFLGVPVFSGGRLLAMYGIANRHGGYDQALLEFLSPFDATVAAVMDAMRRAEEKRAMQWQLLLTKEKAERASNAKTEFLSRMSHELRTPLNAVLGFAQLLDGDPDEPLSEGQKDNVDQILRAGWHLLTLINEVLDLSRIESGKVVLDVRDVALTDVLNQCVNLLAPLAAERRIRVSVDAEMADAHLVRADEVRFKQVLLNLLSNAIKYNRLDGEVRVFLAAAGDGRLRIAVSDTGAGLRDEQLEQLFEAFNRMGAEHGEVEGTGIGLVIAKRLVEMMGGEIGVHSTPGEGSTFWVELPVASGESEAVAALAPEPDSASDFAPAPPETLPYNVLYVEDNAANVRVMECLIARHGGYQLMTARDAETGIQLARQHVPDLILMDINLPGMDGYAALTQLHALEETRHIPVVAISANAMLGDSNRGLAAGFDAYLSKPVMVGAVLDVLRRYTSERQPN